MRIMNKVLCQTERMISSIPWYFRPFLDLIGNIVLLYLWKTFTWSWLRLTDSALRPTFYSFPSLLLFPFPLTLSLIPDFFSPSFSPSVHSYIAVVRTTMNCTEGWSWFCVELILLLAFLQISSRLWSALVDIYTQQTFLSYLFYSYGSFSNCEYKKEARIVSYFSAKEVISRRVKWSTLRSSDACKCFTCFLWNFFWLVPYILW